MKTPLANKAALAIINSTCNPALRHGEAHNVTARLCAEIIARETAADDLLEACKAALLREDIADGDLGDQLRAAVAKATGGEA
jgi:hypothetical protein